MINKTDFKAMKSELDKFDEQREIIIKSSRDILKDSKKAIYSLHRNSPGEAAKLLAKAKKGIIAIKAMIKKDNLLAQVGAFSECSQEYVEAATYFSFVEGKSLPTAKDMSVSTEDYLMGLSDLTGELLRKAVNESIAGNYDAVDKIRSFVADLYALMLEFNFRGGSLRKKFDSIKYNLNEIEDLVLKIKFSKK